MRLDAARPREGAPTPGGCVLQINVLLIVLFNYYYTFLQLDPKDMSDQLKRAGASIPAVRPGRATADYITKTLNRMSILGSAFLGALAAAPPLVESVTGLQVPPLPSLILNLVAAAAYDLATSYRKERGLAFC